MQNLIYLIVHKVSRQCIVIDACWDVDGILNYAKKYELQIVAAIITHYHVDHIGGMPPPPYDRYRIRIDGIAKLLQTNPALKAYAHPLDIEKIIEGNPGISRSQIVGTENGYEFCLPMEENEQESAWVPDRNISRFSCKFFHTPGHTPGSQCILVNGNRLFSGDTLFITSCGRVDFPDSCRDAMFNSLQVTLSSLDDSVTVFPGHAYGGDFTTIGNERKKGLLRNMSLEEFNTKV
jgi:glyoxylase-like metal-dependent hydrolase (beta-lactamase superfamily II)